MVYWPWLLAAFVAGWICHSKLLGLGFSELRKQGMKVSLPE